VSVTARAIGRGAITVVDRVLNTSILTVIVVVMAFAGYALWDSNQIYNGTDKEYYSIWKPTEDNGRSFAELQTINPEVMAWLTVYGTTIDYPVTQGQDNMKYINTNSEGKYSLAGSIFLDHTNDPNFGDVNSILYGHHMEKNAMFGEIDSFADAGVFADHQYGNLHFGGQDHGIRFVAFVHTDAYDLDVFTPGVSPGKRASYVDGLLAKATQQRGTVGEDDRLILLSTCSATSTNGRDLLVGVIADQVYDDPFAGLDGDDGGHARVDGPAGLWLSTLAWPLGVGAGVIIVGAVVGVIISRRRRTKPKRGMK
jgi:sortase B